MKFQMASNSVAMLDFHIANAGSYFEKQGITPTYLPYLTGQMALAVEGVVKTPNQIAYVTFPAVFAALAAGRPITIVAPGSTNFYDIVVSTSMADKLRAQGITAQSPLEDRLKALKGATLAETILGGAGDAIIQEMYDHYGMKSSDYVKLVGINSLTALPGAMKSGQVDGFVSPAPQSIVPVTQKFGELFISPSFASDTVGSDKYMAFYIANRDFIQQHPEVVASFGNALQQARNVIANDPNQTCALYQKINPDLDPQVRCLATADVAKAFSAPVKVDPAKFQSTLEMANATRGSAAVIQVAYNDAVAQQARA